MNDAFSIEDRIHTLGSRLLETAGRVGTGFSPAWLDQLVSRAIGDPRFRVQALRFIDVLPTLQDDTELVQHLREYFAGFELPWPALGKWGLKHSDAPWALHIAAPLVRATLRGLSRRFMGGNTVRQVLDTIIRLRSQGMDYTLDLLGEAVVSEQEAQDYQQACLKMLDGLHENRERLNDASSGAVCPSGANISLKLSSLYSQITPVDPESSVVAIARRLRPILTTAREQGASVTIDMEQYDFRHIVLQCFMTVLMEPEFRDWPDAGIAVQAYLKDAREDLQQLIDWAGKRGTPVQIRLVRGAYWDYETVIAHQHGWQVPVWEEKARTDACFEACLELLFSCSGTVKLAVASHNVRSLAGTMAYAESRGLSADMFEFQMLYGMADELKSALVELGYHLRVYVPFGETLPGMAYLVRRLLENSSGQTILDTGMGQARLDDASLEKPQPGVTVDDKRSIGHFHNQPVHRFTGREERAAFADALRAVKLELGKDYPLIINGAAVRGAGAIASTNPAWPDEVIGTVAAADRAQAEQALAAARDALPGWTGLTADKRAGYLERIAAALLQERELFASWQVLEAGKSWSEADADVCEAIDFLNYYAQQAERLAGEHVNELSGEHNQLYYRPRGIGLVIAPWNFPLAILTGMLSATIVCGNTAILKPSSLTPVTAARLMGLLEAAELPPGVVNFLPGPGSEIGAYLARHPDISIIAFTGSREVGTRLVEVGAQLPAGQTHIKRVIAEMGGKNAIIIDADADLDVAIPGVVHSAFGFQGQKCSAASRVIVVGGIHDVFVERLVAATQSLAMGDPQQPGNFLGPVIDAVAQERIQRVIAEGKQRAELVTGDFTALPDEGHYIAPHIFTNVMPDDPLGQDEIFGPVLAVLRADDFEQAIKIANSTQYALTGGVYSRYPAHLGRAREAIRVGNLYLNRKITGALVSRQPFGGFRLSGIGSKAGGRDYLLQFMEPVCITENTLRRGFAPDIDTEES